MPDTSILAGVPDTAGLTDVPVTTAAAVVLATFANLNTATNNRQAPFQSEDPTTGESPMSRVPPDEPRYAVERDDHKEEYPVHERNDRKYLGVLSEGRAPTFFDPQEGHVYRGEVDRERERVSPGDEHDRTLDPEETLGEFLERVGDELGWESLSAYAREHLEDDPDGRR